MTDRSFTMTRHLPAPPERVMRAWTEPDALAWFANPDHPSAEPTTVDLRVGGAWRVHMIERPGREYWTGGIYREVGPERIVFAFGAVGGWPEIDPGYPDDPGLLDLVPQVSVELTSVDGGTQLRLTTRLSDRLGDEDVARWLATGIEAGWTMTLDRLVA